MRERERRGVMGSGSSKNASLSGSNLNPEGQRERPRKEKGKLGKVFISSCFGLLPPTLLQQVPLFSFLTLSVLFFSFCRKLGSWCLLKNAGRILSTFMHSDQNYRQIIIISLLAYSH
jgi:hypothetical protein